LPRIGVYVCHCGSNIAGTVDVKAVARKAAEKGEVVVARDVMYTCSDEGQEQIKEDIKSQNLDRVVIASCSPKMHERTFSAAVQEAGLNPYLMTMVNIREQDSWVHGDRKAATEKAVALLDTGIARAEHLEPLEPMKLKMQREVAVIGGGIAGITTSLELAEMGYHVHLIEKSASIGGRMAQLSKTYPTLDCAPCILSPKMVEAGSHPNITLHTTTEVTGLKGGAGNFHLKVRRNRRGVDVDACVACGECEKVCPIKVPHEFEEGLYQRKAIHRMFEQAVPNAYAIDFEHCVGCGMCVRACPKDAINLKEEAVEEELHVGAIVVATGFDIFDPHEIREYNFENPAVITAMQLERKMIQEGAGGQILKRPDGKRIKRVGFVFCTGSRNEKYHPYCSKICCTYAAKQALLLKKTYKYMKIFMHYIDVRTDSRGAEDLYKRSMEAGVQYIRGRVAEIVPEEDGTVTLVAEDTLMGEVIDNNVDLAVLLPAIIPSKGTQQVARVLNIPLGTDGFLAERHIKLDPVATLKQGIFAAGTSLGPKDVHESAVEGKAVAAEVAGFLGKGEMEISPVKARLTAEECSKCGRCIEVCPADAISLTDKAVKVDLISCTGCGACVSECPEEALDLAGYTIEGLRDEIRTLAEDGSKVIGFFGDELAYTAADAAGTARLNYSPDIRVIRVPTAMRTGVKEMLLALAEGAEGVLLSDEEHSYAAELSEKRIEEAKKVLEEPGIEKERLGFMEMLLPVYRMLPKYVNEFVRKVERLGPIPVEKRERLRERLREMSVKA